MEPAAAGLLVRTWAELEELMDNLLLVWFGALFPSPPRSASRLPLLRRVYPANRVPWAHCPPSSAPIEQADIPRDLRPYPPQREIARAGHWRPAVRRSDASQSSLDPS